MNSPLNLVIATGIYPPEVGGPAEYARQLYETFITQRYDVSVVTYQGFKSFPTGIRHILYFFRLCMYSLQADYIIALDTFSVGLPGVVFAWFFGKKIVIRVGGDFLWESHVERTKNPILLSEFYIKARNFSLKERIIFSLTRFVLHQASLVVFSTEWQREIMALPYDLSLSKTKVIENMFPLPEVNTYRQKDKKVFLSPSRHLVIKNKESLLVAFDRVSRDNPDIILDTNVVSHEVLLERIEDAYAVIIPSLSEVSPNIACDALRYGVPVIVTSDTGIRDRLSGVVEFIDPLSVDSIASSISKMLDPIIYEDYKKNIADFNNSHSWNEIAQEFIDVYNGL